MALDAAQPFDFEHKAVQTLKKQRMLKIGIIGFGTFGQFLAKRLVLAGHEVSFSMLSRWTTNIRAVQSAGQLSSLLPAQWHQTPTPHRKLCMFHKAQLLLRAKGGSAAVTSGSAHQLKHYANLCHSVM